MLKFSGSFLLLLLLTALPALDIPLGNPISYGGSQDDGIAIPYGDDLVALHGNAWKAFALPEAYEITDQTELTIHLSVDLEGEIVGVGLVTSTGSINASRSFQLAGTQTWGIQDYRGSSGRVVIPVGDHFTGPATYLVLIGDDDRSTPRQETLWGNASLNERAPRLLVPVVDDDAAILQASGLPVTVSAIIGKLQSVTDTALDPAGGYQLSTDEAAGILGTIAYLQGRIDIGHPAFYWTPESTIGRDALTGLAGALQSADDAGLSTYDGGAAGGTLQEALRTMNALYTVNNDG